MKMRILNKIRGAINIGYSFYKNPLLMQMGFFELASNLFKLMEEAAKNEGPISTKIMIGHGDDAKECLTLWCCSGENASYIDRGTKLRKENDELKQKLKNYGENI